MQQNNLTSKPGQISVKLICSEFDNRNPSRAWFSCQCANDNRLESVFKSIDPEFRKYNQKLKMQMFDFRVYDNFVNSMLASDFVCLQELPKFLVKGIPLYLETLPSNFSELNLCPKVMETLLPFQVDGVKFATTRRRALIADEMGCGKTIQAIAVIQHYRDLLPALILAPPNLLSQWEREILEYSSDLFCKSDICVLRKATDAVRGRITLVPYSILDKLMYNEKLTSYRFDIVIADESHNLKNKESKRTSCALPLLHRAKIAVCLSGTPALNRPVELYTQLNGLLPQIFNNYDDFTKRYCGAKKSVFHGGLDVKGSSNEGELKTILEGMVMIRRLKVDVVQNLPDKKREVRYVKPDMKYLPEIQEKQKQSKVVEQAMKDSRLDHSALMQLESDKRVLLTAQYSLTGQSKIKSAIEELRYLIDELKVENSKAIEKDDLERAIVESRKDASLEDDFSCLDEDYNDTYLCDEFELQENRYDANADVDKYKDMDMDMGEGVGGVEREGVREVQKRVPGEGTVNKSFVISLLDEDDGIMMADTDHATHSANEKDDLVDSDSELPEECSRVFKRLTKKSARSATSEHKSNNRSLQTQSNSFGCNAWSDDDDVFFREVRSTRQSPSQSRNRKPKKTSPSVLQSARTSLESGDEKFDEKKLKINKGKEDSTNQSICNAWGKILDGDLYLKAKKSNNSQQVKSKKHDRDKYRDNSTISRTEFRGLSKKILVFAHHKTVLDALEDCIRQMDVGYVRIDGSVATGARNNMIATFQEDDEVGGVVKNK